MNPAPATREQVKATPAYLDAWQKVLGQLRLELTAMQYSTWVEPLKPERFEEGIFTLTAVNPYGRDWVEKRLKSRVLRLMEGLMAQPVTLELRIADDVPPANQEAAQPTEPQEPEKAAPPPNARKVMLQKAYGSDRARIIQPERGMFVTLYFFNEWVPLIGHSAMAVILAARSLCYWNPMTGDKRDTLETDMATLAKRASVSLRTVKDVLNNELVQQYFLRYTVRRNMTPNGVRTAGISLQVRMDDPLTPDDQRASGVYEEEWVS